MSGFISAPGAWLTASRLTILGASALVSAVLSDPCARLAARPPTSILGAGCS